ncbi:MAG: rhodanese-like domain-containing protein [Pseudomonadota bacterium]
MDRLLEFAANHPILVSSAVFLTIVTLGNEVRMASRRNIDLDPQSAVRLINAGATVIDVRSFERYQSGHIINARHIPMDELADQAPRKLGALKDQPVVVYDENGAASASAVGILRGLAFAQVVNLKGGLVAWMRDNFPIEKGK